MTVTAEDGSATDIETKNIVIATGSVSANLPGIEIDEEKIVTSTGALKLDKVPDNLLVIGAGVIGLELGSVWARLGAKVTVVEFLDRILPGMDLDVAKQFQRMLSKQGFDFKLGTKVTGIEKTESGLVATLEPAAAARHRRCKPTSPWSRSAAFPSPTGSGSTIWASSATSAAGS